MIGHRFKIGCAPLAWILAKVHAAIRRMATGIIIFALSTSGWAIAT
jgi:hypothetical protein